MELNENQVWNDGEDWLLCMTHWQLGGVWTTAGKSCLHRKLPNTIQTWKNLEQRHRERTGDQLPEDMRLAILLSMFTTDLEKELTAQQHLFWDFAQMKARIVTVMNSRSYPRLAPPQHDISSEAEDRPSENSDDGELVA